MPAKYANSTTCRPRSSCRRTPTTRPTRSRPRATSRPVSRSCSRCAYLVPITALKGRTLGMRGRKIKVVRVDGSPVGWYAVVHALRVADPARPRDPELRCDPGSGHGGVGLLRPQRSGHPRQARADDRRRRVSLDEHSRPRSVPQGESNVVRVRLRGGLEGAEVPARRQGRQPRRDDQPRPAGAARLHDHHRGVQRLHGRRRHVPRRPAWTRSPPRSTALEGKMGKQLGDAADPLLVSVRSGAAVLDAGDDGHRPQPRPQRRLGRRPRAADRQPALRLRLVPPLRADVRQDRARRRRRQVRARARTSCARSAGVATDPELSPTTSRVWSRPVQGDRAAPKPASSSRRTPRTSCATRSKRCSARGTASAPAIYRRMEKIADDLGTAVNVQTMVFGNKGDDSGTGVAFTRNPATGENVALRRLPHERAGRRRRRRHPHHRAARRDGQRVPRVPPAAARR